MKQLLLTLTCTFLIAHRSAVAQSPSKNYVLLFEDHFTGKKINKEHWKFRLDRRTGGGYIDGLNMKENVYQKGGALHIAVKHELINGKWENTGGGIISKHNFGYGYYECLSKPFMAGRGIHSSFWQRGGARPNNNLFEIDSYEIDSRSWVGANNLYVDLAPKGSAYSPWPHRMGIPFNTDKDGWFLDAYEFTPEGVIFYDNGKIVAKTEWPELNVHQTVWLTALNGCGKVDTTALPGETVFKYFRYYAKDYPGVTILPNGNFEYNSNGHDATQPLCWQVSGTPGALRVTEENAFRDHYKLSIGGNLAHRITLQQTIEYIMNGAYQFNAMVRSSGGQKTARIKIYDCGEKPVICNIPVANEWTRISVPVNVQNHRASFSIEVNETTRQWVEIDDVNFMKPLPQGQQRPVSPPMFEPNAPIWKLAIKEPLYFPGDQRFVFFDRNVGYGDTISVNFKLTADSLANMTPIARLPKTGNAGWSIQLTKDGGLIFKIGSAQNHTAIKADKIYEAGKPVHISCLFESGHVAIYKNGHLIRHQSGITQNTLDKTTPGKLGTVGRDYEAVGDVTVQVGNSDTESDTMKNFRGYIQDLRIYNRKSL